MVNVYAKACKGGRQALTKQHVHESQALLDDLVDISTVRYSTQFTASMKVPVVYKPGVLKAICVAGGDELASTQYQTARALSRLKLVADRLSIQHSRDDLSYVTMIAVDARGVLVPDALFEITLDWPSRYCTSTCKFKPKKGALKIKLPNLTAIQACALGLPKVTQKYFYT